ncbi:MAG: FkbM family methyltransferase [Verrucomicrobia bacterium]|nr:FkbM family methyltransferase [Verrucomicrobiota bacterium]
MKIANPFKAVTQPEYLFRPRQILTRLKRAVAAPAGEFDEVRLPWGGLLRVRPAEVIGATLWYYGIFDLVVAEAIVRLLDPAETAVDVGANIGQMTSLMSHRVGPRGSVSAFEPHPEVFAELSTNVARGLHANVTLYAMGLSDRSGEASLTVGPAWADNRGVARIASGNPGEPGTIRIQLATLDDVLGRDAVVGLCKIDVERHEFQVLTGATRLLSSGRVRDIIFEDFEPAPSRTCRLLADHGFHIYVLWSTLWRPVMTPLAQRGSIPRARDVSNLLATLDPQRATERFRAWGWQVLRGA